MKSESQRLFQDHRDYVIEIVANHGPDVNQYEDHLQWYDHLNRDVREQRISADQLNKIRDAFGPAYSCDTLQGMSWVKPHGYAGDYEIIEKIYANEVTADPGYVKYDQFFQHQFAPQAVRNRKAYFKALVKRLSGTMGCRLRILNLACGPCREMQELFIEEPQLDVEFVCVDGDPAAIDYARQLLPNRDTAVTFACRNILRYRPHGRFHLIWSAGLFDYFDDRTFVRLLSRLLPSLTPGGELAVGNFGPGNTTRSYMEAIAEWYLNHRTATDLIALAKDAGFGGQHNVDVRSEPSGVNLFLHIAKGKRMSRSDGRHHGVKPATTPTVWANSADCSHD